MAAVSDKTNTLDEALAAVGCGFAVFPLHPRTKTPATEHGFKDATTDAGKIRSWWSKSNRPQRQRGWPTESLPPTLSTTTGRDGTHLYYRSTQPRKNTTNSEKSIDIRANGGYVVAPPSVHENGNEYRWNIPFDAETIATADGNTLAFVESLYVKKGRTDGHGAPEHVDSGGRNEKEWSRAFAKWLYGKVCFVPEGRGWRYWDDKHWVKDGDAQRINRLCKRFVDDLIVYAQTSASIAEEMRQQFVTFVNKYNKLNERKKLIEDTKCEVTVQRWRFDAKTTLLNLRNGTLDLETLEFREGHDAADLLSKIANVSYDPYATCEEWKRFIDQSLTGDEETIAFLQVVPGLALTCDTSVECMFIPLGPTRSGKSTTAEIVQKMLNPEDDGYACACNPETFAVKKFDDTSRPSSDVARLSRRRFVVTSEPPKNMLFNAARLKQLTGRDMTTARFLHESEIQFYPQFTLVMTANNAPRVNDVTLFESGRIHAIPFNNHLDADQRDLGLKDRLTEPASPSGILNWCQDSGYQAEGKQAFYRELRERKIMVDSCTVKSVTKRNVMPNRKLAGGVYA